MTDEITYHDTTETIPGSNGNPLTVRTISAMRGSVFGSVTVSPDITAGELGLARRLAAMALAKHEEAPQ